MTESEYIHLRGQLVILREVRAEYPGRTIENIIQNIEARVRWAEEQRSK